MLVVDPTLPVDSVSALIRLAKAKPGALNYGSSGAGGLSHLSGGEFAARAGIRMTHIPFRDGVPELTTKAGAGIKPE